MRLVLPSILLMACAKQAPVAAAPDAPSPSPYAQALDDAMVPLPSEVVDDLLVLDRESAGVVWQDDKVLVTTWSRAAFYDDSYVPGHAFDLYGETWFTAGTQVADACEGLSGDVLSLRVEQLLGLPEGGGRDVFLQVWVDPADLFRPCADPDITLPSCPLASPLRTEGEAVWWACDPDDDDPHARWMCTTWVNRYGASETQSRFPWTALGYTYDWANLDDPVGATEFVAPAKTPVVLHRLVPNEAFCTP